MGDGRLRVICGPTAAGKSAIAMALAERHRAAILSADSRQIYRGFDVGTAKPSPAQRVRVPHFGIDVAEPTERYSASRWADSAETWLDQARASGFAPLVVGGTGFYVRALVEPLFVEPTLDAEQRARLAAWIEGVPPPQLRRWCAALDPARAHLGRAQLRRAVEVALLTGRRLSELHTAAARPPRHAARYLVVDPGAPLATRIERRVHAMLEAGWEDEVRRLMERVPSGAPAWNATGYDAVRRLVVGSVGRDEAARQVVIATRRYAKRQRTWFRHQLEPEAVTRVNPDEPGSAERIEAWWVGEGSG